MHCTPNIYTTLYANSVHFNSFQLLSHVLLFVTPWTAAYQASLSFTISQSLLKLMSIELMLPSKHLIFCCLLLLPSIFPSIGFFSKEYWSGCHFFLQGIFLTSIFPSICIFSNESSVHTKWPKYWSFSISPSNKYSELISFRFDWFDLLGVQGILKSLFQHHSKKASVLQCSVFFISQLSHPYISTRKTIGLAYVFPNKSSLCVVKF